MSLTVAMDFEVVCDAVGCNEKVKAHIWKSRNPIISKKDFTDELKKAGWTRIQERECYQSVCEEWETYLAVYWICPDCHLSGAIWRHNKLCRKFMKVV